MLTSNDVDNLRKIIARGSYNSLDEAKVAVLLDLKLQSIANGNVSNNTEPSASPSGGG